MSAGAVEAALAVESKSLEELVGRLTMWGLREKRQLGVPKGEQSGGTTHRIHKYKLCAVLDRLPDGSNLCCKDGAVLRVP